MVIFIEWYNFCTKYLNYRKPKLKSNIVNGFEEFESILLGCTHVDGGRLENFEGDVTLCWWDIRQSHQLKSTETLQIFFRQPCGLDQELYWLLPEIKHDFLYKL